MEKPIILISNDDSIYSKGIHELVDAVSQLGAEIYVVAPAVQHSGQSSAITVSTPLRVEELPDYNGARMYAVNGTPVDCIKLSLNTLLPRRPDMVLSGINHGSNAGNCAIYSGTIGATLEACMGGIPAVGFSLLSHSPQADFSGAAPIVTDISRRVLAHGLPKDVCLNVNIPKECTPKGVKIVRAALGYWTDEYQSYVDPHGHTFYMLAGKFVNAEPDADDTDEYWLARQYATVVPVRPDQSAVAAIPEIARLLQSK